MIGILCATPEEVAAVRARLDLAPAARTHGPTQVWTGRHGASDIVLGQAGIGKVNAAAAATLLLGVFGARILIFSGVAGGLDPELPVGSVLLADRLAIHDYGIIAGGEFTPTASGLIPVGAPRLTALSPVSAGVAEILASLARTLRDRIDAPVRLGGIVTADYFLNCGLTREALRRDFDADAIDMESGAVSQVAEAWGAPLYVIRTVSDLAGEESHLTYPQMAGMAARNSALAVVELLAILADSGTPTTA